MNKQEALEKARVLWGFHAWTIRVSGKEELYVVGINLSPNTLIPHFVTKGKGKSWEEAFKNTVGGKE